ncbi:MAG TPA: hypothetical protein VEB00_01390 [Clostridia bacterium]|nr:hypothetical protein [Clostridia bacterium]
MALDDFNLSKHFKAFEDKVIHVAFRYSGSVSDQNLKKLEEYALENKISWYIRPSKTALKASLEGKALSLKKFMEYWFKLDKDFNMNLLQIILNEKLNPMHEEKFEFIKNNYVIKKPADEPHIIPKRPVEKDFNTVSSSLEKIPGFRGSIKQGSFDEFVKLVKANGKPLSEALGIDLKVFLNIAEESQHIDPSELYNFVLEKLEGNAKEKFEKMFPLTSNSKYEVVDCKQVNLPPRIPKKKEAVNIQELSKAMGSKAEEYIKKSGFSRIEEVCFAPVNSRKGKFNVDNKTQLNVRNTAILSTFDGMNTVLAAALVKKGFTLEKIAQAKYTEIVISIKEVLDEEGISFSGGILQYDYLSRWREKAERLKEILEAIEEAWEYVTINAKFKTIWPSQSESDAHPLHSSAVVNLLLKCESETLDIHSIVQEKPPFGSIIDKMKFEGVPLKWREKVERIHSKREHESSYNWDGFSYRSENEPILATARPDANGNVSFEISSELLFDNSSSGELYMEILFDGTVDGKKVKLNQKTNALKIKNVLEYNMFADPKIEFGEMVLAIIPDLSDINFFGDPLEKIWDSLIPEDPVAAAGPYTEWKENTFNLYGTVMPTGQDDNSTVTSYSTEVARMTDLLRDLSPGGTLLNSLCSAWKLSLKACTSQRNSSCNDPCNNPCNPETRMTQKNCLAGHKDVWAVTGYIDSSLEWTDTPSAGFEVALPFYCMRINFYNTYGIKKIRDLGKKLSSGTIDEIFTQVNYLQRSLRDNIALVQNCYDNNLCSGEIGSELVQTVRGMNLPSYIDKTDIPSTIYYRFYTQKLDIWQNPVENVLQYTSEFPYMEHLTTLTEMRRLLPIIDDLSGWVNYHYLRKCMLEIFKALSEAHLYLGNEEFNLALSKYALAENLIQNTMNSISLMAQVPVPEGKYPIYRIMVSGDAFEPVSTLNELQERPMVFGLFCLLGASVACDMMDAMMGTEIKKIIDGNFAGNPVEDMLHYLRSFVIPACKGELYLRKADWDYSCYSSAFIAFQQAAYYLPSQSVSTCAGRFLWLRIARTYLQWGTSEYNRGNASYAYSLLLNVFSNKFGSSNQIYVPSTMYLNNELKYNPVVLLIWITAVDICKNIDAQVNPLGYPENFVPAIRYDWVFQRATEAASLLDDAEMKYINFRVNAEDAMQRIQELQAMLQTAMAEVDIATINVNKTSAEYDVAVSTVQYAYERLRNATDAYNQFSSYADLRLTAGIISMFVSIVSESMPNFTDFTSMTTDDDFQRSQLARQVEELNISYNLSKRNTEVSKLVLDAARSSLVLAGLKKDIASNSLAFETGREFNYSTWFALADEMRDMVKYRLQNGLRMTYLAQQAYYFMSGQQMNVIQYDYSPHDTAKDMSNIGNLASQSSYLMGQHIRDALALIQSNWVSFFATHDYQGRENSKSLTTTVNLERNYPMQFKLFQRYGGKLEFDISLEDLDLSREGSYHQMIEDVEVFGIVGNMGSQVEISGSLKNSPYSVVRMHDPINKIQDGLLTDWIDYSNAQGMQMKLVSKYQPVQTLELSGTLQSSGDFSIRPASSSPVLAPFEYNGLAQNWVLEIKKSENPTLDFTSIISLGVRFKYAIFKSTALENLIASQRQGLLRSSVLLLGMMGNYFAPGQQPYTARDLVASLQLREIDIPIQQRNSPTLTCISLAFVPKQGQPAFQDISLHITCDRYTNSAGNAIDVVCTTEAFELDNSVTVQMLESGPSDNPLNSFTDSVLTDVETTPWLKLLTSTPQGNQGATFKLRINLDENPDFDISKLDYVAFCFIYNYSS